MEQRSPESRLSLRDQRGGSGRSCRAGSRRGRRRRQGSGPAGRGTGRDPGLPAGSGRTAQHSPAPGPGRAVPARRHLGLPPPAAPRRGQWGAAGLPRSLPRAALWSPAPSSSRERPWGGVSPRPGPSPGRAYLLRAATSRAEPARPRRCQHRHRRRVPPPAAATCPGRGQTARPLRPARSRPAAGSACSDGTGVPGHTRPLGRQLEAVARELAPGTSEGAPGGRRARPPLLCPAGLTPAARLAPSRPCRHLSRPGWRLAAAVPAPGYLLSDAE